MGNDQAIIEYLELTFRSEDSIPGLDGIEVYPRGPIFRWQDCVI